MLNSAKQMESLGLKAVGYNWVNLDDCYSEKQRSESGEIIAGKSLFSVSHPGRS
jgi:alpha-galactosidase